MNQLYHTLIQLDLMSYTPSYSVNPSPPPGPPGQAIRLDPIEHLSTGLSNVSVRASHNVILI